MEGIGEELENNVIKTGRKATQATEREAVRLERGSEGWGQKETRKRRKKGKRDIDRSVKEGVSVCNRIAVKEGGREIGMERVSHKEGVSR